MEESQVFELRPKAQEASRSEGTKPWRQWRLSPPYVVGLFFRLNIYAWLLLLGATVLGALPLLLSTSVVWWGVVAWVAALVMSVWASSILLQFPRKIALVRRYRWHNDQGQFEPSDIAHLCGDPCYRLVASEILRYTPNRGARKTLIRHLRDQQSTFGLGKVTVDPERGVLVLYNGKPMG